MQITGLPVTRIRENAFLPCFELAASGVYFSRNAPGVGQNAFWDDIGVMVAGFH